MIEQINIALEQKGSGISPATGSLKPAVEKELMRKREHIHQFIDEE